MRTDGLFSLRSVTIPAKYNKPIRIIPIGDVHYNNPAFAREKWDADRNQWAEYCRQGNTYFLTTGDIFEALSTTERSHFSFENGLHDSNKSRWEKEYAREVKQFAKEVEFMRGRTLAVFGGNHFFQFYDGTTSDMALASELNAPYVGSCGYLIVTLKIDNHHSSVIKIFVHHGKSSGKRAGSSMNSLEDAASYFSDADIILAGHDHKAGAMTLPALKCSMGQGGHYKIKAFDRIIGRTGSYLKSYEAGTKSYAHDALYRPSTLGGLELILTPIRDNYGSNNNKRKEDNHKTEDRYVQIKAVI